MTNGEKISEFMSKIQDGWSILKKARYICLELCEIYDYNPEYAYGDLEQRGEILSEAVTNTDKNKTYVMCASLANIYMECLINAGLEDYITQIGAEIIINLNDDDELDTIVISIEKELYPTKTKSAPEGFKGSDEVASRKLKEKIEKIDKELRHIDENGYNDLNEISHSNKIEDLISNGISYMANTIKKPLQGVHLHQFFKHLLRTSLPSLRFKIFPLFKKNMENITYALISSEDSKFKVYLYDKSKERFNQTTINEIKKLVDSGHRTSAKRAPELDKYMEEI